MHPALPDDSDRPDPVAARPEPPVPGERPGGSPPLTTDAEEWERPPARLPVARWRGALTAVLVLLVGAATWWAVSWLSSPAPPSAGGATVTAGPTVPGEAAASTQRGAGPTGAGTRVPPSAPSAGAGGSAGPGPSAPPAADADASPAAPTALIRVHVAGEVRRPGVVTLPAGSRVDDAVRAAGGPGGQARPERINLAAPLADGDQVLVPSATTPEAETAGSAGGAAAGSAGRGAGSGTAAGASVGGAARAGSPSAGTVDLNRADAAALQTLPGIGPATAQKIIAHRESVGPFTGLQDLDAVPGIGPAALERLRGRVSW